MVLKNKQLDALKILEWLSDFDSHRGEGRSVAIAVALIRTAIRTSKPVRFWDHVQTSFMKDEMRGLVVDLIHESDAMSRDFLLKHNDVSFTLYPQNAKACQKWQDWLPA